MPIGTNTTKRGIENVFVHGYEKRRKPRKHYVYMIVVSWTDHSRYEIYRRYSEFFSFQSTLLQLFPAEAKDKTIPTLPNRIFIGRSHVAKVAEARVDAINIYCQKLITLDEKISSNIHVTTFFGPLPGDKPLEKLELGRPASLHPLKIPTGSLWEEHCVVAEFEKDTEQQLSVNAGAKVIVVSKDESGWWLVQDKGKVGWVPAAYLQKCSNLENGDETGEDDSSNYLGFVVEENSDDIRKSTSPVTASLDAELYRAIAGYEAQEEGQISFEEDQLIHVIDKMEDGWWFVSFDQKEGWVPNSYLEPIQNTSDRDSPTISRSSPILTRTLRTSSPPTSGSSSGHTSPDESAIEGQYAATASYIAQEHDEISLPQGTVVDVLKKSVEGWWTIRHKGQTGLFPAAFLQKHETESYFLQIKHRKSGHSFYNRAPPPRRRTVRKTAERGRKRMIRKASPRLVHAAELSSTGTSSSDSDNYKQYEITDKTSQEDSAFWGRKPVVSRMRSSSTNSDSSSNESGSRKASRETTPELSADAKKNVMELKELFARRSLDEQSSVRRSPQVAKKKYSGEKPAVAARSKPNTSSDSPNVPLRPRQSEIVRAHFANAFSTASSERELSSSSHSMEALEEVSSELEASTRTTISPTKPKKPAPPTPPRKESLQNSPSSSPEARRRSKSITEAVATKPDGDSVLQDKAMEAILKALIQKNGPELQNLVKQAVASDPELLKLALSNNQ